MRLAIKLDGRMYHLFKADFKKLLKILKFRFTGNWQEGNFEWTREETGEKIIGLFSKNKKEITERAVLGLDMEWDTYVAIYDFWTHCLGKKFPVFIWRIDEGVEGEVREEIPNKLKMIISFRVLDYDIARKSKPLPPTGFLNLMKQEAKKNLVKAINEEPEFKFVKLEALRRFIKQQYDMDLEK